MNMKRLAANALGFVFLGLGAAGIFLPLLPATPFLLLAAICFSKGSQKFYRWIRRSPCFGSYIENHYDKKGVALPVKIKSIAALWAALAFSMLLMQANWAYVALPIVGACVTVHLLLIKTRKTRE